MWRNFYCLFIYLIDYKTINFCIFQFLFESYKFKFLTLIVNLITSFLVIFCKNNILYTFIYKFLKIFFMTIFKTTIYYRIYFSKEI